MPCNKTGSYYTVGEGLHNLESHRPTQMWAFYSVPLLYNLPNSVSLSSTERQRE